MKIGIIPDSLGIVGTSTAVQNMAMCLKKLGQDISYIIVDDVSGENDDEKNRRLVHTKSYKLKDLVEVADRFDVVLISNGVFMPFELEASRFAKTVLMCEIMHFSSISGLIPSIDVTIAVSEHIYREMQPRANDILIPNGIDLSAFTPPERRKRDRVRIIQVAAAGKTMNPDLADIAGELLAEGLKIEAHLVGRSGDGDSHIVYHGMTDHDQIPYLVSDSDILLHMSEFDTFGMAPVEAMSVGTIPIVSNVGGLPYSVEDGVSGFVRPFGDKEAVKDVLRTLISQMAGESEQIERMRENCIARVKSHFNIETNAKILLAHLKEKQSILPRLNRTDDYPFSLIALAAHFVQFRSDAFLDAIEDIFHATNLQEAFKNWRAFLRFCYKRYHNFRRLLISLDRVYDRMLSDLEGHADNARYVFYYWLAVLAVVLNRPERAMDYLLSNDRLDFALDEARKDRFMDEGLHSLKTEACAAFGNDVDTPLLQKCHAFKNDYFSSMIGSD